MPKTIAITGATGNQGGSVARHFLQLGWTVHALTRNTTSASASSLASAGAHLMQADLDDAASLAAAFKGAHVIYGVTDFWQFVWGGSRPTAEAFSKQKGIPLNRAAMELEVQQGRNIADAASRTEGLERYVWSTLSDTVKWTKGRLDQNLHFDGKASVDAYIKEKLPELAGKTSYLQVGLYLSNLGPGPWAPKKQADGSFVLSFPSTVPSAKLPWNHPPADTGRCVQALVEAPAGKTLLQTGDESSYEDWVATFSKVYGVKARYEPVSEEAVLGMLGPEIGTEIWHTAVYHAEYGYDGGDPDVLRPRDLGVKDGELMTAEKFLKETDYSSVLNA